MNTSIRNRNLLVLFVCLFLGTFLVPSPVVAAAEARLIIRRAPDLGANVIVRLAVDGQATYITYGHTYSTMVSAGRHTIAVAPTPNAKWKTGTPVTMNMVAGKTYIFTVRNDNSGQLTLMRRP